MTDGWEQLGNALERFATKEDLELFRAEVGQRFEAIDRRFEAIDRRFEAIDRRFEAIERRFDQVNERLEEQQRFMKVLIEDLRSDMRALFEGLDLRERVGNLEQRTELLEQGLEDVRLRVHVLEQRLPES